LAFAEGKFGSCASSLTQLLVCRYMPGYELFLEGIQSSSATWAGHGLKLLVGREREILATETF